MKRTSTQPSVSSDISVNKDDKEQIAEKRLHLDESLNNWRTKVSEGKESGRYDDLMIKSSFDACDTSLAILSLIFYMFDVVYDVIVAVLHFKDQNYVFSGLTMLFVFLPTAMMSIMKTLDRERCDWAGKIKKGFILIQDFFLIINFLPAIYYIDILGFGSRFEAAKNEKLVLEQTLNESNRLGRTANCQSNDRFGENSELLTDENIKENEEKIKKLIWEMRENFLSMLLAQIYVSRLRQYECFFEAVPQLTLQLYIILSRNESPFENFNFLVFIQLSSIVFSFISIVITLLTFFRIHKIIEHRAPIRMFGNKCRVQFASYLSTIVSRILSLALCTVQITYRMLIFYSVHWILTFVWIFCITWREKYESKLEKNGPDSEASTSNNNNTEHINTEKDAWYKKVTFKDIFQCFVYATFFVYCYIKPVKGKTRFHYAIYYGITGLETLFLAHQEIINVMCDYDYFQCRHLISNDWYQPWSRLMLIIVFVSFFLGLILKIIYYRTLLKPEESEYSPEINKDNEEDSELMNTLDEVMALNLLQRIRHKAMTEMERNADIIRLSGRKRFGEGGAVLSNNY